MPNDSRFAIDDLEPFPSALQEDLNSTNNSINELKSQLEDKVCGLLDELKVNKEIFDKRIDDVIEQFNNSNKENKNELQNEIEALGKVLENEQNNNKNTFQAFSTTISEFNKTVQEKLDENVNLLVQVLRASGNSRAFDILLIIPVA